MWMVSGSIEELPKKHLRKLNNYMFLFEHELRIKQKMGIGN